MNSTWFRRFTKSTGGGPRLVCFPHAGGSATAFKELAHHLPNAFDVLAVQYPGRQDRFREEPFAALDPLVTALAAELTRELAADPGRPYAFFGHSMGALVAFETARILTAERRLPAPERLFLSGRGGPEHRDAAYEKFDDKAVLDDVLRLGGTDQAMLEDPDLLELVMPALRADYRLLGAYEWGGGEPIGVPVTALTGDSDPMTTVEDARTWQRYTNGDFALGVFPGGHFYLFDHLEKVAAAVTDGLLAGAAAG